MMGRAASEQRWALRVGSTHDETRRARSWVGKTLQDLGCTPEYVGDVLLALGEALSNVVRHGYGESDGHPIDVTIVDAGNWVDIIVEDEAPVFLGRGTGLLPDPSTLAEGGYGLFLIHSLVDELVREPRGTAGNRLLLRKYRTDAASRKTAS